MNSVQDKSERRSQKSLTASRHDALHLRLVQAATAAIEASGLATLRARNLADAVGCSVGAIYGVFPDLDALILAVNGETLAAIDAVMRAAGSSGRPAEQLVRLSDAYLDYAATNRRRWGALFEHRMPEGQPIPDGYAALRMAAFSHVEAPIAALQPKLTATKRALLARTLFAAVHGMVMLGLDEKVTPMTLAELRAQMRLIVRAVAHGLDRGPE